MVGYGEQKHQDVAPEEPQRMFVAECKGEEVDDEYYADRKHSPRVLLGECCELCGVDYLHRERAEQQYAGQQGENIYGAKKHTANNCKERAVIGVARLLLLCYLCR